MLHIILIVVAVLIVLVIIVVAMQPGEFRVARSATIAASAPTIFAHVNELKKWEAWSPWAKLDPAMNETYEGPPAGVGSIHGWSGNKKVGEGRMTITDSKPTELVRLKLEFLKPFKATNTAEFTFQPQGNQTLVTWAMTGKKNFVFKAFHLIMNMDKLIGTDFEKGLAQMKTVAESAPKS